MTYAGKIRAYLIIAALLPPLLIMSVIYFSSIKKLKETDRKNAAAGMEKYMQFDRAFKNELRTKSIALALSEFVRQAALLLKASSSRRISIGEKPTGFDFAEIIDDRLTVLASAHRPGLLGGKVQDNVRVPIGDNVNFFETVEYDSDGAHASNVSIVPIDTGIFLYCGWYINDAYKNMLGGVMTAEINLIYRGDEPHTEMMLQSVGRGQIYEDNGKYFALLGGNREIGYYLIARFKTESFKPLLADLIKIAGVVALVAAMIAILLGIYITGKAKKEIGNLVEATARVASGDFNTTVMAYEEGEFAQLADSFSEMVTKLKGLQGRLAISEKIAAWKIVGQKVAHEIKNPLTPIAISIDDLRRSYKENLPDFDSTLMETTTTMKKEIDRLTKMLDEFVAFARMNPPVKSKVKLEGLIDDIKSLYQNDINIGRLKIDNRCEQGEIFVDREAIKQVLINLVKNSFESAENVRATISFLDHNDRIEIKVEDTGPGFSSEILEKSFTPYMTTKKDGSGLGLAICQRIVFDHDGIIELYNRTEGGAGVKIVLPVENG